MRPISILLYFFLTVLSIHSASAQKTEFSFFEYLNNKGETKSAIYLINKYQESSDPLFNDSLNYLKGWFNYSAKQLDTAAHFFNKINRNSAFYPKSTLFASYCKMHLNKYNHSENILTGFTPLSQKDSLMQQFMFAGLYLLQKDFERYSSYRSQLTTEFHGFSKELKKLDEYQLELTEESNKKAWFAGLLSAVLPGSGQVYLGKRGQGISTFIMVAGLAAATTENYIKRGPEHFATIFLGTVFTSFYIGNIYGSVKLASVVKQEKKDEYNAKILFNLHIPLRNLYN